jgi:hypothetical protein
MTAYLAFCANCSLFDSQEANYKVVILSSLGVQ